jgi:hypothetical protein
MEKIDKASLWVVWVHGISFGLMAGSGFLKQFGFFNFDPSEDVPRSVFMTTDPAILWVLAASFGICVLLFVRTRRAWPAFIGAGVHGIWASYCTHLALVAWISTGTELTIIAYWLATIKLIMAACVIARNQAGVQKTGTDAENSPAQP